MALPIAAGVGGGIGAGLGAGFLIGSNFMDKGPQGNAYAPNRGAFTYEPTDYSGATDRVLGGTVDRSRSQEAWGWGGDARQHLLDAINQRGESQSQLAYQQARDDARRQVLSQLAGARGGYNPANFRNALQAQGDISQNLARGYAQARVAEEDAYQQRRLAALQALRQGDMAALQGALGGEGLAQQLLLGQEGLAQQYAGLGEQSRQFGATAAMSYEDMMRMINEARMKREQEQAKQEQENMQKTGQGLLGFAGSLFGMGGLGK